MQFWGLYATPSLSTPLKLLQPPHYSSKIPTFLSPLLFSNHFSLNYSATIFFTSILFPSTLLQPFLFLHHLHFIHHFFPHYFSIHSTNSFATTSLIIPPTFCHNSSFYSIYLPFHFSLKNLVNFLGKYVIYDEFLPQFQSPRSFFNISLFPPAHHLLFECIRHLRRMFLNNKSEEEASFVFYNEQSEVV